MTREREQEWVRSIGGSRGRRLCVPSFSAAREIRGWGAPRRRVFKSAGGGVNSIGNNLPQTDTVRENLGLQRQTTDGGEDSSGLPTTGRNQVRAAEAREILLGDGR